MSEDFGAWFDAELQGAPKTLTDNLFHYTNADAALFGILSTGSLRLSPFDSTNDLWESRPTHPTLTAHADDVDLDVGMELWDEIDLHIRRNAKVACLTMDWDLPERVMDRDALRGWGHLSLWAHYGGAHSGVCLRFNKPDLLAGFESGESPRVRSFHGPVQYRHVSLGAGPHGIDIGQVREFGVDVVAIAHAEANSDAIFLQKHRDWANEAEYRLVRMDESLLPYSLDIRHALTGVFLGDAFPRHRLPALHEVLSGWPEAEVFQARFHNRKFFCWPQTSTELTDGQPAETFVWDPPRRTGSFVARMEQLRQSQHEASDRRARAEIVAQPGLEVMAEGISEVARTVGDWPQTDVQVFDRIEAVPAEQRSRRPGVSGERVHFEAGHMVVVNATHAECGHVLLASAAIQVLDDQKVRVHAAVTAENMAEAPNHRTERWRWMREGEAASVVSLTSEATTELGRAVAAAREPFDAARGRR